MPATLMSPAPIKFPTSTRCGGVQILYQNVVWLAGKFVSARFAHNNHQQDAVVRNMCTFDDGCWCFPAFRMVD